MSIAHLRKQRGSFEDLAKKIDSQQKGGTERKEDERLWQCGTDENGNGSAVIRFLPAVEGEEFPYIRMWTHGFKGPGGWYIENSRTTLGEKDPVAEFNTVLWQSDIQANKDIVSKFQKRKLSFYSNVLVIRDSMNPENEGKVKLFRYGTKIFDKLKSAMKPEFDDEKPMNPFCPWEGADFKLKITRVEKRANFDKSALSNQSAMGTDEEIEAIYAKCYPLLPIVAPDQFKSYEDLEKRLNRILNVKDKPAARAEEQVLDEDDEEFIKNVADTKKPAKAEAVKESKPAKKPAPVIDDDEDSELKYFQDLANN